MLVRKGFRLGTLALAFALALAPSVRAGENEGLSAITPDTVRGYVDRLASEEFAGRGSGEEGGRKASDWIAAQLAAMGVEPAGDEGSFFQGFSVGKKKLRNVVGTIRGGETDEVVVFGAHYDHLGMGHQGGMLDFTNGRGKMHPGADDNASGTAGLLSLAKAFTASGERPRRRVVFVFFDGEELGLYGSRHYVRSPSFPLEQTAAMLNMDMIGRPRGKLTIYGANTGSGFDSVVAEATRGSELKVAIKDTMPPNSDHFTFYRKKIPSIALFTGLHADYHRATDTADKVDAEGTAKVLRIAFGIARRLAQGEEWPVFAKAKDGNLEAMIEQLQAMLGDPEQLKRFGGESGLQKAIDRLLNRQKEEEKSGPRERPAAARAGGRKMLGVQLAPAEQSEEGGVTVDSVVEGGVAEKAGVEEGDVIVELGGAKVDGFPALRKAVEKAEGKTKLVVLRGGKRVELTAEFVTAAKPAKRWL